MTINSVIRKNKHNQNTQILNVDGKKVPDSEVPSKFVNYFTNIATNLTDQLPSSDIDPLQFIRNRNPNSFVFFPANNGEIKNVINDLKDNGIGLNKISNSVLKYSIDAISPILTRIIYRCIQHSAGILPL